MGVWPDPQGNPLLIVSEHVTLVYLECWSVPAEPADYVCKLTFDHCWATRTMSIEFSPYESRHVAPPSQIYEVSDSLFLKQSTELRQRYYPEWKNWDTSVYRHFVISGHDAFVEVIAKGYLEERVQINEVKYLLPLLYRDGVYGLNES